MRPYKIPVAQEEYMQKEIQNMLEQDIIEEAKSTCSSPLLIVKKKSSDGKEAYRLVIDFRALNLEIQHKTEEMFQLQHVGTHQGDMQGQPEMPYMPTKRAQRMDVQTNDGGRRGKLD